MPIKPGPSPAPLAIQAWNLMGGLDWQALPLVADLLGIDDLELLVMQLVVIRDSQRNQHGHI